MSKSAETLRLFQYKSKFLGLPWWSSGKESALQHVGNMGSIPGQGTKIPHATGQLSPQAITTELARLN